MNIEMHIAAAVAQPRARTYPVTCPGSRATQTLKAMRAVAPQISDISSTRPSRGGSSATGRRSWFR